VDYQGTRNKLEGLRMSKEFRSSRVWPFGGAARKAMRIREAAHLGRALGQNNGFSFATAGYGGGMESSLPACAKRSCGAEPYGSELAEFSRPPSSMAWNDVEGGRKQKPLEEERLFELIRARGRFVACKAGPGTLVETRRRVWENAEQRR